MTKPRENTPIDVDDVSIQRPNWHPEIPEPDRDDIGHGVTPELAARALLIPIGRKRGTS